MIMGTGYAKTQEVVTSYAKAAPSKTAPPGSPLIPAARLRLRGLD
jgi:hypothetical protein